MRKVIYSCACSLDGYLAGPDSKMDWLRRKTWEMANAHASDEPSTIKSYVRRSRKGRAETSL